MDIQQQQKQSCQVMSLDKDGTHLHCKRQACSSPTGRCQVRVPEHSPFAQGWDFREATAAGQKDAGIMLSTSSSATVFLKDFPWVTAQTSLLLLLGLLLLTALGFIWKLRREKDRECWIKDWKKARSYAAHVTLDPNTAFFELFLSEDHRSVKRRNLWQNLPEKPERFSFDPCVLGCGSFSSGRHYWEVEVGDRTYWELGCSIRMQALMKMALSLDSSISPPYLLHLRPAAHSLLRIHNVRASDSGNYLCYFQDGNFYEKALLELKVAEMLQYELVQFNVLGPAYPVLAVVGENVMLRCHLSPEKNAEDMEVRWFRAQFSPAVFVYKGRRERTDEQMEQYRGRTTFVSEAISEGSVGLIIHNVTAHENGFYCCYFQEGRSYDEAIVHLIVISLGSKPVIEMKGLEDGGIRLECVSAGWYPKPQAVWRDPHGKTMPPLEESYTVSADGLFLVTTAVIIRDHSMRNMSCSVSNTLLNQEKETVIFIPESFIPRTSPWMVALAVILPTLPLLIAGSIYLIKKLQLGKKILSMQKEADNEEKEITRKELGKERVEKEKECQTKEQLQEELRWRRSLLHAADVVLDPDTAHPELFLSEDQRSVRRGPSRQSVPDNPERFDCRPCVLGLESYSLGRHFWEVDVENVMVWAVGVCRDNVERKGEALLVPQNGFWTLEMFENQYRALSSPEKILPLKERIHRVGVFLDCEAGDVSFYNMKDRSHIYTCPRSPFSGPLRPFFRLGSDDSPLYICPSFRGAQGVTVPEGGLVLYRAETHHNHQFPGLRTRLKILTNSSPPASCCPERLEMAVFPNSCLLGCLLIFIALQLPKLDSAPFDVIGPPEPILAMLGEDAELPCRLSPNMSAEGMELRWFREKVSPAVFVSREGREQEGEEMAEYRGRVSLVEDHIAEGSVAVRIQEVKASDDGEYRCFFRQDENYEEAIVHLKVAALGSEPHISMKVQESGEILLECTSVGWHPEPQVQWRTHKGEEFPSMSESRTPDEEGLFTVRASVIIRDTSMKNVSCCIRNLLLGQEKEVEISIPEKLLEELMDVTLDPDTAHPHLFLYEDSKSVRLEDSRQKLPEKPERFDSWPCVMGREAFTSGRHYWEVEVGDRTDWAIGVCRENVMKKGFDPMTPENGFWAVELYGNGRAAPRRLQPGIESALIQKTPPGGPRNPALDFAFPLGVGVRGRTLDSPGLLLQVSLGAD
ncbi:hypothetical protein MJT46_017205 [Ovis ammon polii x Ovis aries]|nr:hypothetical protein MJT46_017205 [Ovis ammon polii x Ovis aries]